jgi:hypothetical protein
MFDSLLCLILDRFLMSIFIVVFFILTQCLLLNYVKTRPNNGQSIYNGVNISSATEGQRQSSE